MLEDKDKVLKVALELRDGDWLNSLEHCKQSYKLMTYEHINNRITLESISKRQCELVKSNVEILDWAMKTVSEKKKVSLLNIQISDYVPYTLVLLGVDKPYIPFTNPNKPEEITPAKIQNLVSKSLNPSSQISLRPKRKQEKVNIFCLIVLLVYVVIIA